MEAVNTHITQNNKIKHTFMIHHLLCPPSCKHAHSRGTTSWSATLRKASHDILLQQTAESYLLAEWLNTALASPYFCQLAYPPAKE